MTNRFFYRDACALTRRAYALAPVRRLRVRVAVWALVGSLSALGGAAAVLIGEAWRAGLPLAQCLPVPVDKSAEQAELARVRFALAEEAAARAAVQKTADSAAAEVARLNDELQFLRGQRRTERR